MTILDSYKTSKGYYSLATLRQLDNHNLLGYLYLNEKEHLCPEGEELCRKKYLWQQALNLSLVQASKELVSDCLNQNIQIVFLKGLPLLNSIYKDIGERYLSDIDVFVKPSDALEFFDIMKKQNYIHYDIKKWAASKHKDDFRKTLPTGLEIDVDVHYKLIFNIDLPIEKSNYFPVPAPNLEVFLFHLITHLGYQHTYLRLNWLLDVFHFCHYFYNEINWTKLENSFKESHLENDLNCIKFILHKYFNFDIPINTTLKPWEINLLSRIVTPEFLLDPQKNKIKYYTLKHFLSPNLKSAIKYDILWLWSKVTGAA
ncbi:MAG: nucleotidyltransferase family protein [Bdellovibrionales bacterium]|nr:nucleotidyltransferase family protein [Bdellovibrionales bacterium]